MKNVIYLLIISFFSQLSFAQQELGGLSNKGVVDVPSKIGHNGFYFSTLDSGINTKFSEFGTGFFKDKLVLVSSKKIGGLSKADKYTHEGFRNLFCADVYIDGMLDSPILFSRILNTHNNEDQLAFSPDSQTLYYTRSSEDNSSIYKLYITSLEKESYGNWISHQLLDVNTEGYSIENPFVNKAGNKIYFSSNKPGGFGGYDLYESYIKEDGTLSDPINLGPNINTAKDDKYPSLSNDDKQLYFSSNGHVGLGGFDIYTSRIKKTGYGSPVNLGNTINTVFNEVAFFFSTKTKGYFSSDKTKGKGSYDIYKFDVNVLIQQLNGSIVDSQSRIALPNAKITLLDDEGAVVSEVFSDNKANYHLDIIPFETYTIKASKEGFEDSTVVFSSTNPYQTKYSKDLELVAKKAKIILVEDKMMIKVDDIYFDYNKATIKKESRVPLNSVVEVLNEHPEMNIEINAHSDNRGNDKYNLWLSEKRAKSALRYLVSQGLSLSRLISKGYGESNPKYDCKSKCTDEEHQANRRIEFVIVE